MGSGKTTLGERLAAALGATFIDLDARLTMQHGGSIREILEAEGETSFRRRELQLLQRLLVEKRTEVVVATGGGIVEIPEAAPLLRQLGRVVWLRADPEICIARLGAARQMRPLLDDGADWRGRYERREPLYRQAAQSIVDTDQGDIEASLAALLRSLGRDGAALPDGA